MNRDSGPGQRRVCLSRDLDRESGIGDSFTVVQAPREIAEFLGGFPSARLSRAQLPLIRRLGIGTKPMLTNFPSSWPM